jgi:hypothetical protein
VIAPWTKKFPHILLSPNVHYHDCKSHLDILLWSRLNQSAFSYLFKIHLNNIISYALKTPRWLLSIRFSGKIVCAFVFSHYAFCMSRLSYKSPKLFVTFLSVRCFCSKNLTPTEHPGCRTAPCQLSIVIMYTLYSQLPSVPGCCLLYTQPKIHYPILITVSKGPPFCFHLTTNTLLLVQMLHGWYFLDL